MDGRKICYIISATTNAYILYHLDINWNQLWSGLAFNSAVMVVLQTFELLPKNLKENVPDTIHSICTVFAASILSFLLTAIFLPQIEDLLLWGLLLFDNATSEYMKKRLYFCSIQSVQGVVTFLLCLKFLHSALVYTEFVPRYKLGLIRCAGPDNGDGLGNNPLKKKSNKHKP